MHKQYKQLFRYLHVLRTSLVPTSTHVPAHQNFYLKHCLQDSSNPTLNDKRSTKRQSWILIHVYLHICVPICVCWGVFVSVCVCVCVFLWDCVFVCVRVCVCIMLCALSCNKMLYKHKPQKHHTKSRPCTCRTACTSAAKYTITKELLRVTVDEKPNFFPK